MKLKSIILFSFVVFSIGLAPGKSQDKRDLYQNAIKDAMCPETCDIDSHLISIDSSNNELIWKEINGDKYILAVSWKQQVSYYKNDSVTGFYNTGIWEIWVTVAPELLNRVKQEKMSNPDLRLKQLLGLPPNSTYSYFVEFWVRPQDLFRPCPDNEITDNSCGLCFPENTDSAYIDWVNANRISRYYNCGLYNKYPWTQLGYTYDWNPDNTSHVGLSEFVIGMDKNIVVNHIYTTTDYLKK